MSHISVDFKKLVLRLAVVRGYKYKKIRKITGVSERSIGRDSVASSSSMDREMLCRKSIIVDAFDGRPRIMNGFEVVVFAVS